MPPSRRRQDVASLLVWSAWLMMLPALPRPIPCQPILRDRSRAAVPSSSPTTEGPVDPEHLRALDTRRPHRRPSRAYPRELPTRALPRPDILGQ